MKFVKSSLLTGLYVMLPVLLLWIGLRELGGLLAAMADPIADMFPSTYFDDLQWPGIMAGLLIAATAFLLGLLAKVPFIANLGHRFELSILDRVPMYTMLKLISRSLVTSEAGHVTAAILKDDEGGGDPCYVMEEHDTGLATVLLPWSPASFAGSIKVVPKSRLEYLGCTFDEFSRSVSFMGVGVAECLEQPRSAADRKAT